MCLEMDGCRGCSDGGGCEVEVSGDDGWQSSLRYALAMHVCQARPVRTKIYGSAHRTLSHLFPLPRTIFSGEQKQ
jgi:hypothetical protein